MWSGGWARLIGVARADSGYAGVLVAISQRVHRYIIFSENYLSLNRVTSNDLPPEEARQYLIRFLGRQDLDEHEEIYDELATE